ncbi:MAG: hypothetical protein JXB04_03565 [Kiritimatiellae bacterium]|nr:hypothetical protein [Kiritimatiellia bacterium]
MRTSAMFRWFSAALACLLCAGCGTLRGRRAPAEPPPEPQIITRVVPAASVIRVNPEHRYVILECTVLPNAGEEAKVYRGDDVVAELRVTERRRGSFVAADILSGVPRAGDAVRLERVIRVSNGQEVPL